MKYKRELIEWQMYWTRRNFWRLFPSKRTYSANEDGPAEQIICIGPLQMRFFLWEIKA